MQGQYGDAGDKRLRAVASEMWQTWGFRKGIMRGYWVSTIWVLYISGRTNASCTKVTVAREIPAYAGLVAIAPHLNNNKAYEPFH